jgi:hypothetical protein
VIPHDDVTFKTYLDPFCIHCGSSNITADKSQDPFYAGKERKYLVIPLACNVCEYHFSVHVSFVSNSPIKEPNKQREENV